MSDLAERVERLETLVAALTTAQQRIAESIHTLAESASENAQASNMNFDAIVETLTDISARLGDDSTDQWWRQPHD